MFLATHLIVLIVGAVVITAVLVIGTLGAAGLLPAIPSRARAAGSPPETPAVEPTPPAAIDQEPVRAGAPARRS